MLRTNVVVLFVAAVVSAALQVGCKRQDNRPIPKEVSVGPGTQQPVTPIELGEPKQVDKGPAPKDAIEIHVVAKQWLWKFQHPSGIRESGELHVPVGRPFKLTATSEDVIHCLAIPGQNIKDN
jgi:heme/copper-type cytochrome/quinol oxidase subunit 2